MTKTAAATAAQIENLLGELYDMAIQCDNVEAALVLRTAAIRTFKAGRPTQAGACIRALTAQFNARTAR